MERITFPFGQHSTALEVAAGIDLTGRHVIVTGGASGIGVETARALAHGGAAVTLAVRDVTAGERVAAELSASIGREPVRVARLDLADGASVAAFTRSWQGPLHVLVNNAGVMALPESRTADGHEMQFATNHLGHFALALGLREALAAGARGDRGSRIVSVSSSAHLRSPVIFDDIHFAFRKYDPILAYAQSKTANVLFAVEATRLWSGDGITANALMPGAIATNLQRHTGGIQAAPELRKTTEQGAATSVLLATSPALEGVGGRYFADCNEGMLVERHTPDMRAVAPFALDAANAERLWELSLKMIS